MKLIDISDGLLLKLSCYLEPMDIKELMLVSKDLHQRVSENAAIKNRLLYFELSAVVNEITVD